MPRKSRLFVSGGIYHVYCRTHRGEVRFSNKTDAISFIDTVAEVTLAHQLTVFLPTGFTFDRFTGLSWTL